MALMFYIDEHVPQPITVGLRVRSVDVLTALEDGRSETDDALLLDRATELGRILFSFDADMLREAARRQNEGVTFAGMVFAHPIRISMGECINDLSLLARLGEPGEVQNQVVYLPL